LCRSPYTSPTDTYTLSLHDALPIYQAQQRYRDSLPAGVYQTLVNNSNRRFQPRGMDERALAALRAGLADPAPALAFFESPLGRKDRKSTRLNSSHVKISYAVFCLKK